MIVSEIPFSILAVLLAGFLVNVPLLGGDFAGIGRVEGCVLLFFYFLFMLYVFGPARTEKHWVKNLKEGKEELLSVKGASLRVILGILALVIGGKWVVDAAVQLAEWMGMSKGFIGLTLVAVGTSLPELATSVTAAFKKNSSIAVGNVVGSNIFNIFWILGLSGLIAPLPFEKEQNADISIALFSTTLLLLFLPFSRSKRLAWPAGLVLLLSYGAYLAYLIARG